MTSPPFEPKIIAFLCNWCSYSGADAAGRAQKELSPTIKIVRVMCSGRVDPQLVVTAFREGADGVLVLGCHPGDCHYKTGNTKALRRMTLLGRMLAQMGVNEDRLRLDWVSASEADRFAQVTLAMVERIRALGPLLLSEGTPSLTVAP
jgi:F420-non-reducing hydrogenase iron-sulfur subunit